MYFNPLLLLAATATTTLAAALKPRLTTLIPSQVVALNTHNSARARYGANPLEWNDDLAYASANWASACVFQHSNPMSQYGENLYAAGSSSGGGPDTTEVYNAINGWMAEVSSYDYNNPGFSSATGHFTQVVWKSTTAVGCATRQCPAGTIFPTVPSWFTVCRYTPPGNYANRFPANVGQPVT